MSSSELDQIQRRLAYQFQRESWLAEALTHASYLNEARTEWQGDNERLEFLGDAVLNLAISEYLIQAFPDAAEGELSKLRSRLVSKETLSLVARRLGLGDALRLGRGETITQGRNKSSILADALEAVCAAIYLDGGWQAAAAWIKAAFAEELGPDNRSRSADADCKTDLQEVCQRLFNALPKYRTIGESGPDHEKMFEVEILIRGERYGVGIGRNKKEAEQRAARQALEHLRRTEKR
jgi:ribonuclease III